VDASGYPRRRKSCPNLGHVCVAANSPIEMCRAIGLGFHALGHIQTDSNSNSPNTRAAEDALTSVEEENDRPSRDIYSRCGPVYLCTLWTPCFKIDIH
jgi:hypothetical protein